MMDYGIGGAMGGFGGLGMVVWGLVWIAVVVLAVWGATALFAPRRPNADESPPEVLKRRFARGELTLAEFEQAKRALG